MTTRPDSTPSSSRSTSSAHPEIAGTARPHRRRTMRRLTLAALWALPVVAVAVAAPVGLDFADRDEIDGVLRRSQTDFEDRRRQAVQGELLELALIAERLASLIEDPVLLDVARNDRLALDVLLNRDADLYLAANFDFLPLRTEAQRFEALVHDVEGAFHADPGIRIALLDLRVRIDEAIEGMGQYAHSVRVKGGGGGNATPALTPLIRFGSAIEHFQARLELRAELEAAAARAEYERSMRADLERLEAAIIRFGGE